jgi:hypothetical protein
MNWSGRSLAIALLGVLSLAAVTQPSSLDPAMSGTWSSPIDWPADAVHSILLHTGKVLWFRGDEDVPTTWVWDPATNQLTSQTMDRIVWCGGHTFLPDGRVLATGGATSPGAATGPPHAYIFDPVSQSWTRTLDMVRGRYYPSQVVLGDGRTLVLAGTDELGSANDLVEAYLPGGGAGGTDAWDVLTGANRRMTYYPRLHLMGSGRVLHSGPEKTTEILDPFTESWQSLPSSLYGKRTHGTSVMLPPGLNKVLIVGGHDRGQTDPLATATAEILDLSQPSPSWRYTAPMSNRRMHLNAVVLPDGKVLVAGGTSDENITPVYPAEMFDPATETWTTMAPLATFRGYHSSMVLLPDGRVVMAGSNGNSTAEIYSPPYLFRGARPTISSAPSFVPYGQPFTVQTAQATSIASAVLMRPGASTHAINMEQRYVPVPFTVTGSGSIQLTPPGDPTVAPPGYYMLFLLNGSGVPSVASFVRLGGPAGNRAPSVDAGPNQSVILPQQAVLDGTVADDGLPLDGTLATTWSVASGPAPVTFGNPAALDTSATFTIDGTYVLRLTAADGELSAYDQVTVVVNAPGTAGYPVESRIAAGSDDVEESPTGGMSFTSSDLEMVVDGLELQKVGLRFNNLPIPNDETIVRAWIQFTADEKQSEATSLSIRAQAIDHAPAFQSSTSNLSSRALTGAAAVWNPAAWNTTGAATENERTPNLADVVQEVVSRPGWATGNSMVFVISGSGHRTARAFEYGVGAAVLHVELASLPVNHAPLVDAGMDRTIRLPEGTNLDGTVNDDGLPIPPGRVTTRWVQESGPGIATFANPLAVDTTVTFSAPGRYELELSADDGELLGNNTLAVFVEEEIPGLVKLDTAVTVGSDDAEEKASGSMSITGGDLELVQDSSTQKVGVRFPGLAIPQGATIVAAWIQFQADETQSEATNLTIRAHAADNAPTFTTTKFSVSGRPRTTAAVTWTPPAWNVVNEASLPQRTPDLSAVIQEIVNRPGWASGNAIAFIITGTGHRTAEPFEGGAAKAPKLHVEFN